MAVACSAAESPRIADSATGREAVECLNDFWVPCHAVTTNRHDIIGSSASTASNQWIDPRDLSDYGRVSTLDTGPSRFPEDFSQRVGALKNLYVDHLLMQQECFKQIQRLETQSYKDVQAQFDAEERTLIAGTGSEDGIPDFWMTVLQNVNSITKLTHVEDLSGLRFLRDIRQRDITTDLDSEGFQLEFEFAENPFFSNKVLTKSFGLYFRNHILPEKAEIYCLTSNHR